MLRKKNKSPMKELSPVLGVVYGFLTAKEKVMSTTLVSKTWNNAKAHWSTIDIRFFLRSFVNPKDQFWMRHFEAKKLSTLLVGEEPESPFRPLNYKASLHFMLSQLFERSPNVKHVDISGPCFVGHSQTQLETFYASDCRVTTSAFSSVFCELHSCRLEIDPCLSQLQHLVLNECRGYKVDIIGELVNLVSLRLRDMSYKQIDVSFIGNLVLLKRLDLCLLAVRAAHLKSITRLNLTSFFLDACIDLKDDCISYIETQTELETLTLKLRSEERFEDSDLFKLTSLTNLQHLAIRTHLSLSDKGIGYISSLLKLESLSLKSGTGLLVFTQDTMETLNSLPRLSDLHLRSHNLNNRIIGMGRLLNIRKLVFASYHLRPIDFPVIENLQELIVNSSVRLAIEEVEWNLLINLSRLYVMTCVCGDTGMLKLLALPELRFLSLQFPFDDPANFSFEIAEAASRKLTRFNIIEDARGNSRVIVKECWKTFISSQKCPVLGEKI